MSKAPGPHRARYLDPHTGILTDLIGACTTTELATAEADPVTAHIRRLFRHPPEIWPNCRPFTVSCSRTSIPGRGSCAAVELRKTIPGAQPFLLVSMIPRSAGFVFDLLATAADW